jgi:hypothetical protein
MKVEFINDTSQVQIQVTPENETECVALRLFIQYNDLEDDSNIIICTNIEEKS